MTASVQKNSTKSLYDRDFYLWIATITKALKEQDFEGVDWENLIEEIESMARSERKEIKSRLTTLIEHLLKLLYWAAEKDYNGRGWRKTVVEQRRQIDFSLEDSPSLRIILADLFFDCYQKARKDTLQKYNLPLDMFPSEPPFTLEDALNSDYLP